MQTGHEEPMRRTLEPTMRHLNWMTLAFRPRAARDEDKSCVPKTRVYQSDLIVAQFCSCPGLIAVCLNKEFCRTSESS